MTEADRSNELCRFCGLTKDSGTSGSITQYIRTCVCSLGKEEGNLEDILDICLRCKKHIGKGRKGSFTQYIFRSELCDCPQPLSLVELEQETEDPSALSKKAGKSIEEAELELDPAKFPLDRYIPLLELGRGASGRVYLARDRRLQKRVAIKVLTSSDQNQLLAFQEEAKNTSRLNNPYIVRILDFGIAGGSYPYMVLEYLQGISLEDYLKEHGPLAPDAAASIFVQLCLALEYAHEGGVFHRDLKPSNVILSGSTLEDCRVKLIDFGVAKTKHELMEPTIIQGRTVVGTPAYMSPDQVQGKAYDARSEIYSLGCLMFETLSGSVPFTGETALEILRKHAEEPPPDLSEYLDLKNAEAMKLKSCIERCLAKDSDKRFQSARALREALEGAQENLDLHNKQSKKVDKRVILISASVLLILTMVSVSVATNYLKKENESESYKKEAKTVQRPVRFSVETYRFEPGEENFTEGTFYRARTSEDERKRLSLALILNEIDKLQADTPTKTMKESQPLQLDLSHWRFQEDDLKLLAERPVTKLNLSDSNLDDSMISDLINLPLTYLNLSGTKISDTGFENILKVKNLDFLNLLECDLLSEKCLEEVSKLEKLKVLTLGRNLVTDRTLEYLSRCKSLDGIDASHSNITEKGLRSLAKLKSLRLLILEQNPHLGPASLDII